MHLYVQSSDSKENLGLSVQVKRSSPKMEERKVPVFRKRWMVQAAVTGPASHPRRLGERCQLHSALRSPKARLRLMTSVVGEHYQLG